MHNLYPAIKPYSETFVNVSLLHTLSVSQSGNPEGIPVIVLHGGPGGGRSQRLSQFFDPARYRIILFDQRGCGKSLPYGELAENNTEQLVEDIEKVRKRFGIDKWLVFGGSWGAQLALRYGFSYPQHIHAFVLRSPFLGRRQDLEWRFFPQGGAAQVYPDHYRDFSHPLAVEDRSDPIEGYRRLFSEANEFEQLSAARQWSIWKGGLSHLLPLHDAKHRFGQTQQALALAKIESHFYSHHCFMPENFIVDNIDKLAAIAAVLVHGRYDMVCKLEGSQLLAEKWDNCQLQIVPGAGHSSGEPGVIDALIQATDKMADWLY
ncbi:prolyl aminopeptidase [Psychrobium sp. 1_MG-2023]|uniref:prolyl aminopeptidase n=1 Tax=Psychrobium sp. 1_MG-2023 TaxID=3062624 RepID=UPI000C3281D8|nr:prolyl aminopeptidase [Psychrobium sp. 1_MG-2023]MDP2560386.1 prolyl aminopeptidase [Psychrobium sp. 1_MG-2023]PKF57945.1 prolyl aminopeptidase [Alteromonadales bacterium alter-6D02]